MPGLLHAVEEGLAWRAQQDRQGNAAADESGAKCLSVDDWTWLTVAVLACANSCDAEHADLSITEEQVEVCLE